MKTIWILFVLHGSGSNPSNITVAQFGSELACVSAQRAVLDSKVFQRAVDYMVCVDSGRPL